MRSVWLFIALAALVYSEENNNDGDSDQHTIPDNPDSHTVMLFGFRPEERDEHYSRVTPAGEDLSLRKWKILDAPLTAHHSGGVHLSRGISATGRIREFRFYGNSNSATDTTSVYICLLEPLSDGNYQVVLATMMPMTGPEDALFRVTELDSDYWDSLDNIARPGMVMAVAVETSDVGNLAHGCGVSFKHADQDVCGTTYTYVGNLQLGTIVDRSQMTANQRCMKMSLQLVVDI